MLATFNLQLSTLDVSAEAPALQGIPSTDGPSGPDGFAALLKLRVADATAIDGVAGDALPLTGNLLPERDIAITVDGIVLESGGDAEVPLLPVADEQPWESLLTPPGLELSASAPATDVTSVPPPIPATAEIRPASGVPAMAADNTLTRRAGSPVHASAAQFAPVTPADSAAPEHEVTPIPTNTAVLSREAIVNARDTGIAPGAQPVIAREIQPREIGVTQVHQIPVPYDGHPVLQDTAARPAAAPLQPLAPVPEQPAEPARHVVQPGVPQATVPTPVFQPGAFANLAPAAPQADSALASALQQQVSDLIDTPVRETNWGDRIGERVVMMANNQLKTAEIRLTPAELGPVRVQVNVEDGAANITFQAQHAVTREALEQALPRLREMFAESGLSLGQTSVGEQNVAGNRDGNPRGETHATGEEGEFLSAGDEMPAEELLTRRHEGLLDTFV